MACLFCFNELKLYNFNLLKRGGIFLRSNERY
nr:MAG TPA: hypothetical protein [Caudoviricetes sp.]